MKRKRIVIFGANGMLGHDLRKVLEKDYDLVLTDIQDGDIIHFLSGSATKPRSSMPPSLIAPIISIIVP